MPKKKPYIINSEEFRNLNDIRLRVRAIRDSYPDGVYINPADLSFMSSLLLRHDGAEHKIGCGISGMYVKTVPVYKNNRGFWLVRTDGTETDFSFEQCLRNKPVTRIMRFKEACRTEIGQEMANFKHKFFESKVTPVCPFTGEILTLKRSHVDHIYPWTFERIVNEFITQNNIDINAIRLTSDGNNDGLTQNSIVDNVVREKFLQFHNIHAKLRVISPKANLSIVKQHNKSLQRTSARAACPGKKEVRSAGTRR